MSTKTTAICETRLRNIFIVYLFMNYLLMNLFIYVIIYVSLKAKHFLRHSNKVDVCTVDSRFLEPSLFRTSRSLEPKVVSSPQSNTVILPPISRTIRFFEPNFRFPWSSEKSGISICMFITLNYKHTHTTCSIVFSLRLNLSQQLISILLKENKHEKHQLTVIFAKKVS